jgi:hypothetical protein
MAALPETQALYRRHGSSEAGLRQLEDPRCGFYTEIEIDEQGNPIGPLEFPQYQ